MYLKTTAPVILAMAWLAAVPALASRLVAQPTQVVTFTPAEFEFESGTPLEYMTTTSPTGDWLTMTFVQADASTLRIAGFWDGGRTVRVRFAPTVSGPVSFTVASRDTTLNGLRGTFTARAPTAQELGANSLLKGFLSTRGHSFLLGGKPAFLFGDTNWRASEEFYLSEFQQWMDAIRSRGLNHVLITAWRGSDSASQQRNKLQPFTSQGPTKEGLQPDFFRNLDRMIQYANNKGISVGLMIGGFPAKDNGGWVNRFNQSGKPGETLGRVQRWFRYIVARYAAYNVRWVLFGEIEEGDNHWPWGGQHAGTVGIFAPLVKQADPYKHPLGSHSTGIDEDAAKRPDIDYVSLQTGASNDRGEHEYQDVRKAWQFGKPVCVDEYWYEIDKENSSSGLATGVRNSHRNLIEGAGGLIMGSLMRNHLDKSAFVPSAASSKKQSVYDYLIANDKGLKRMSELARFWAPVEPDLLAANPDGCSADPGSCGKFGSQFGMFVPAGSGKTTLDMSSSPGLWTMRVLEVQTGKLINPVNITGGKRLSISVGTKNDASILISPAGRVGATVLNFATRETGEITPGGMYTLEGKSITGSESVTIAGVPARVVTARPGAVLFVAPDIAGVEQDMETPISWDPEHMQQHVYQSTRPRIFTMNPDGTGLALTSTPGGTYNPPGAPVQRGSIIGIWVNGLGAVSRDDIQAWIGGVLVRVLGLETAPESLPGTIVVIELPAEFEYEGEVSLRIEAGGIESQADVVISLTRN